MEGPRVNERIRKSPVRLIGADGKQIGVVEVSEAREHAREAGLDLVEVGPNARPPVVKIVDWGKLKYEREKQARDARKKTHTVEVKQVKYRPNIDTHDFDIKTKQARRFLESGKKVKVTIFFLYRQLRRPELGEQILDRVTEELADVSEVESRGRLESRQMVMILTPKNIKGKKAP